MNQDTSHFWIQPLYNLLGVNSCMHVTQIHSVVSVYSYIGDPEIC